MLKAVYKYSTLHGEVSKGQQTSSISSSSSLQRWRSSYASEEIIFWRVAKAVAAGNGGEIVGVRNGGEAIGFVKVVAQWMGLFTEAATAFSRDAFGAVHSLQAKDEMESSRAAFLLVLLGVCENEVVLGVFGQVGSRGVFSFFLILF